MTEQHMATIVSISYSPPTDNPRPDDHYQRTPFTATTLVADKGIAGDRKSKGGKRRYGNRALRRALTEAAKAAARTKKPQQTYLRARYWRLVAHCGKKKAAIAVGHTILRIVYHVLTTKEPYHELTLTAIDERRRAHLQQRALAQLQALGYDVTITPTAPAA